MMAPEVQLVVGPAGHGVVQHSLEDARLANRPICRVEAVGPALPAQLSDAVSEAGAVLVRLHVTDHLLGSTPAAAARFLEELAVSHELSITLHDLPQHSDGPTRFPERAEAYRRIAAIARHLQVSSRHELRLLQVVAPGASADVEPLPVPERPSPSRPVATTGPPTVGVLGYLYPGKGHLEVLEALDAIGRPDVRLVALGRPSPGHDWLVDEIRRRARSRQVEITGYLDDHVLDRRVVGVTVPVFAPTHISASASLLRWIACGRRPVAVRHPYVIEVAERHPGTVNLAADLPAAVAAALDHPASTWHGR